MTKRIVQLDAQTIAAIAAGEVVENPASIVKELCENSLDAGSDLIRVELSGGGIRHLRISDNGHGMHQDDALIAFDQHATSKVRSIEDIEKVLTMGFRGEALASIAAVSKVTLETREPGTDMGTRVVIHGGELLEHVPTGCREGTTIVVEDLFYNVPARYKFLKKDQTEASRVADLMRHLALARPDVSFHLTVDRKEILHSPGDGKLTSAIYALFGSEFAEDLCTVEADPTQTIQVHGMISVADRVRKSRNWQMFFVNQRLVQDSTILRALEDAYQTLLMKGRYPAAILFLEIPHHLIDVNVHPQKTQIRFWNKEEVYRAVYHQVKNALYSSLGAVPAQPYTQPSEPTAPVQVVAEETRSELKPVDPAPRYTSPEQARFAFADVTPNAYKPVETKAKTTNDEDCVPVQESEMLPKREEAPSMASGDRKIDELREARFIGQLFHTYLFFETIDSMLVVDQHAAHEKILYEQRVHAWMDRKELPAQLLLQPVEVACHADDLHHLEEAQDLLHKLGYDWSIFGEQSIVVRAVPQGSDPSSVSKDLKDLLANYQLHAYAIQAGEEEAMRELLATQSCKAAVKAHDRLAEEEVRALIDQMAQAENPWHCPHGRPVVVRMTRQDMEKLFRRIV